LALNEEYVYDDAGHLVNASFLITASHALDLPMIDAVIVRCPIGPSLRVRGIGEINIVHRRRDCQRHLPAVGCA